MNHLKSLKYILGGAVQWIGFKILTGGDLRSDSVEIVFTLLQASLGISVCLTVSLASLSL